MDISFVLRKFRKSISGFTVLALLTSLVSFAGVAQAATFTDTDGHWGEAYIEALYTAGVVSGNPDGSFAPDNYLNRAELSKMLVLGYTEGLDSDAPAVYPDVAENDWYYEYANDAYQKGIMTGEGNGTFNGAAYVNRAVLMQAVYNAAGLTATGNELPFSDVMESDWFYDAVDAGYFWSIVDGKSSTSFDPAGMATRAEASKVIYNGWYPVERDVEDPEDPTDPTEPSSEGTLLMSVSSDTPEGDTVPSNATSVEMFAVDLTAEDDDVVLESVTFNHYGVSSLPTDHSVYAYAEIDGVATRLTSGQTVNSSTHDVKFNNLDLEVAEDETVRLSIRMDVGDTTTTKEVAFQVESADMVDVNGADVSGDFPLEGETFSIASDDAGTITIEKNGSVSNPQVGEDDVEIAKFKMTATTEAASLQEIGLYISGSINTADIEDFKLYVSGEDEPIATADAVDSLDVVRFMVDDYAIAKGGTKSLIVTADFNTGRTSDTIKVYVDEDTDVLAIGDLYGFGMSVTRTAYDGNADACASSSSADCSYSSLEGGDLTISSNGPAASDVAINGNDVVLMNFDVTSVTDVTFKNFPVGLLVSESAADGGLMDDTASNFTDIKIVDTETGDELFSSVDANVFTTALAGSTAITEAAGDNAQAYHLYTDDLTLTAGEELSLSLMADIENNTDLDGETVVASLQLGTTYPELRDVNNKVLTNSSVLVPASAITSKTHTVRSPSLALSLASTPVSDTFVKGSEDVPFTGVVFACGEASDCRVTDLTVTGYLDAESDGWDTAGASPSLNSFVGSIWLEDSEGSVVSGPESVDGSAWTTSFNDIDWTLEAGDTEILYVVGDISSDAFTGSAAEKIAFGVTASTGITVEDEDGNGFTASGTVNTAQSTFVTTSDGGSLTVSVDASTAREDIVVAGTSDVEVSSFKFESTDEAFVVNKLAINARQSSATSLGDYDNNVSQITLSYENSEGVTEEATGFLTSGTANFSGLDLYVGADDSAVLTVYADLNTISGGAAAGEFVDLNLAFGTFEAIAEGSGETYKASKLDAEVGASSDLDFGTMTFVDSTLAHAASADTVTLNTIDTVTVPDLNVSLPVGTLVKFGAESTTYVETTDVLVVLTTKYTDGDTSLTGLVANDDDGDTNGDQIYYALPGTGYLTSVKQMHVYESKPTIALSSSSPSGSKNTGSDQEVFKFDITADDEELVQIRAAVELDQGDDAAGVGALCTPADDTSTGDQLDGTSSSCTTTGNTAADTFAFDAGATGVLSAYARVNFWIKWTDAGVVASPTFTDLAVGTGDTNATTAPGQQTALSDTACGANQATLVTGEWYNCDLAIPAGTVSADQYLHFVLVEATELVATDTIHVDQIKLYNEKLTIDVSTDTDLDTYANNADNAAAPVAATLKEGGTTVATAYIGTLTNGASAATTGTMTFLPTTAIEIAEGATKTFSVNTSTTELIAVDSGEDDAITFSIGLGSSSDGTVTAGDFWWHETNATVKWLGDVSSTTLNGNSLIY